MSSYDHHMCHPSPASSCGVGGVVDSAGGTPYTSLTAFSPEDVKAMKSPGANLGSKTTGSSPQDPFVSSGAHSGGRLSAKASAFQPSFETRPPAAPAPSKAIESSRKMQGPNTSDHSEKLGSAQSPGGGLDTANPAQFGAFTTDSNISRVIKVTGKNVVATFLPFVEAAKKKVREHGFAKRGSERPEQLGNSYYLRLANISDATELYNAIKLDNPSLIIEYVSPVTFGELFSPGRYSVHEGQVLLTINYPSDATLDEKLLDISLVRMLEMVGKLCAWHKVTGKENGTFHMLAEFEDASYASGVVTNGRKVNSNAKLQDVTVSIDLFRPDLAEQIISQQMYPPVTPTRCPGDHADFSSAFGNMSLDGFGLSPGGAGATTAGVLANAPGMSYMAASPNYPMTSNLPFVVGGHGSVYMPRVVSPLQQTYTPGIGPPINMGPSEPVFHSFGEHSYQQGGFAQRGFDSNAGFQQSHSGSPLGHYSPRFHEQTREVGNYNRSGGRRPYAPRVQQARTRQQSGPTNSHHNHVDIAKIRQGIDVRTTVMLRNIPNKVDQAMLKEIVDESSFGRYDFMYLRIDFSNNCNVGYAFINFTDPLDIVDFVIARSNQKWHRFKSDKVAEVSYATIQGKDCLVQKFRNSSVMLEPPHYRPKLFKTIHDQFGRAGEEERFPDSDNASKLKRSCENAEHVGLFAPSAGQHLRDEQRRRRSQYDRGTSLAEREENGFDDPLYSPFGFPPY